jgi:hypothetical protein
MNYYSNTHFASLTTYVQQDTDGRTLTVILCGDGSAVINKEVTDDSLFINVEFKPIEKQVFANAFKEALSRIATDAPLLIRADEFPEEPEYKPMIESLTTEDLPA